jgi:conjugation system TraG family ATPase
MAKKNKLFARMDLYNRILYNQNGDVSKAYALETRPGFSRSFEEILRDKQGFVKAFLQLGPGMMLTLQYRYHRRRHSPRLRESPSDELQQANDRHYKDRTCLELHAYLIITQTANSIGAAPKLIPTLTGKNLVSATARDELELRRFEERAIQVVRILEQETGIGCRELPAGELMGTRHTMGITEPSGLTASCWAKPEIKDFDNRDGLRIGEEHARIMAVTNASQLPPQCSPVIRYDTYSTDKTCFPIEPGAYMGSLLPFDHITTLFIIGQDRVSYMKDLDKQLKRHESLGGKDSANLATQADIRAYREILAKGEQQAVRMHINIMIWADDKAELNARQQQVTASLTRIGITPHLETLNALGIVAAIIPGNGGDLPINMTFPTFGEQASCFVITESQEKDAHGPSSIPFGDRTTGIPVLVDLYDQPKRKGIINNFHKTVVGPSGSGKSVWLLMLLLAVSRQGHHAMILDIGASFKRLCQYLGGRYFDFGGDDALQFNPFLLGEGELLDTEKTESLIALLMILWKMGNQAYTRSEYIAVSNIVTNYYAWLKENPNVFPCFNSLYDWLQEQYIPGIQAGGVREKDFDWTNFLYVLRPYYLGGEYEHVLNSQENMHLLQERFVVFELDKIRDHAILFPVVMVILMELYISKLRKIKGVRKFLVMDEVWKVLMTDVASGFVKWAFKTGRKFNGEVIVATQDIEDLTGNEIVKNAIINNADTKIIMDVSKLMNRFDEFQAAMGLTEKDKMMLLSLNRVPGPGKEFFVTQGNGHSRVYRLELSLEELMLFTTDEPQRIKIEEYTRQHGGLWEGIKALAADVRSGAVKWLILFGLAIGGLLLPNGGAKAQIIDIADAIIKEALETADLKIQRLQTQTLLLQNAEKALENTMAGDLLDDITGWVQQQEQLFAEYYGELWQVKSALTGFSKVAQLIERQAQLVKEYQRVTAAIQRDPHFSPAEVSQMLNVYSGILNASVRNTGQLALIIQGSMTQMEDAGRLRIIDETATRIDRNYSALERYSQENTLLSLQRAKDEGDIQTIKTLYGIQ